MLFWLLVRQSRSQTKAASMEAASKMGTTLLLNLALFMSCFSAAVSSNPSFHRKGPIRHDYTRFADVERHCQSVLSSAAELGADADRAGARMHQLSFTNGDWSQDAGQAPLLPFHGTYADTAAGAGPELLEAVPLSSFALSHTDMAPRRRRGTRTAFNVSGLLIFTISRNCCCSYMEPSASPEFELRPGLARLQGVYTETKPSGSGGSGGERVLCMVGDAVLPVRGNNSAGTWDWAKNNHGGGGKFELPVVADGNILLVLRYPMTATLTNRAVRGEMTSTAAESGGANFDTVRLASPPGGDYDSGYQFQLEEAELDATVVAGCGGDDPLFHDGGGTMEHLNLDRGSASLCDIVHQSAPGHQAMEVIPNRDCKGTDAFCSRVGPFNTSHPIPTSTKKDMAFSRSGIAVQSLECKPAPSADGTPVAAVFRYVPPWEHQPTAARRTGLGGSMILSAEGVWLVSTEQVCMVACLDGAPDACRYCVTLSIQRTLSLTRHGNNIGQITAMDGSYPPPLFQQRVRPRETTPMSYAYTKVEQAWELLRDKPTGFRDNFVAKSLLNYPNHVGAAHHMLSLSNLADDLNLRFRCAVKPAFVPEWVEGPLFELQILSVGSLVGSYSPQFQQQLQGGFSTRIELLGRVASRVHAVDAVEKQQILNVSAEFTASRSNNLFSSIPVLSLEGVYNPEDGRMHLIGCRNVHGPWRVLSNIRDLQDGMDCSIEVTVEYPRTTTRWLISRPAKVSVASTRRDGDTLHFNRTELHTLPVVYREQRRGEQTEPVVEGLLCVAMLSATVSQLRHVESHADVAPYISLAMLGVQALGYSATLVTNAKVLPALAWPARRYKPYYYYGYLPGGWYIECSVKPLTLAALLLTARLAQKVRRARARARARSPLEPGRVPGDGAVMLCSAGVHLGVLFFVLAVHWLNTHGSASRAHRTSAPGGVVYDEAQGMTSPSPHMRTRAAIVEGYVGVVKEWFLMPQVVGDALWRVNCKPLAARYYAGVTVAWLLPHVYGYLRPPVVNTYEAHDDGTADFYSKASAVVVPVVGLVLALMVYVQQRWNYRNVGWAMGTEKNKLQHIY